MEFSHTLEGVRIVDDDFVAVIGGDKLPELRATMDRYQKRCGYFVKLGKVKDYWLHHNLPGAVKFDLRDDWFHIDISTELFGDLTPILMGGGVSFECHYKGDFPCMKVELNQFLEYMGASF